MGGFSWLVPRPAAAGDPTHALFAAQSHSIVDNLVALLRYSRAWNCSGRAARAPVADYWRTAGFGFLADMRLWRPFFGTCEGFRTTADCDRAIGTGAVVRKRPGKEP